MVPCRTINFRYIGLVSTVASTDLIEFIVEIVALGSPKNVPSAGRLGWYSLIYARSMGGRLVPLARLMSRILLLVAYKCILQIVDIIDRDYLAAITLSVTGGNHTSLLCGNRTTSIEHVLEIFEHLVFGHRSSSLRRLLRLD